MQTGNIVKFLQAYPDDRLAALRAHTEDGKLSYWSCCCLVGSINPEHALLSEDEYCNYEAKTHIDEARKIPFAEAAEEEFRLVGHATERRAVLLPLIIAEQERREKLAQPSAEMHEAVEVE